MNNGQQNEPSAGVNLGDIYYVIFRHKWKVLLLAMVGVAVAALLYHFKQPPYQSDAKLLVRYISDIRAQNPVENNSQVTPVMDLGKAALNSELEILRSFDLAKEVATNIGPDKILAKLGDGNDLLSAAFVVSGGLSVDVGQDSSVIHLTFRNRDPNLVQLVLAEIIKDYLDMHTQVHRSAGISDELLTEETTQLKLQIAQTEEELQAAKTNAGIIDLADSQKAYADEIARIRSELRQTEAVIAEHEAVADRFGAKPEPPASTEPTNQQSVVRADLQTTNAVAVPPDQLEDYKAVCSLLTGLQKREDDYLSVQGYTEENKLVKEVRSQITEAMKKKASFEAKFPSLVDTPAILPSLAQAPTAGSTATATSASEQPVALQAKLKVLQDQLAQIGTDAAKLSEAEIKIADLERKKDIQEKDYQSFANSLDQARIDENLGPGQVSDIKTIEAPTPPYKDFNKLRKALLMVIVGGILAGFGWAFLTEFVLDHTIKRPGEIAARLRMSLFLSVPDLNYNNHKQLALNKRRQLEYNDATKVAAGGSSDNGNNSLQVTTPWVVSPALSSYSDALRDRLVLYFESINLTRKPKLVAITSASRGSGVSTIAAGLAASLSETGDGRVLLVDMNLEQGAVQQFLHGKPGCKLDDALEGERRENAMVQENLYVVTENSALEQLPRILPKRFAALVPKLRASDYDYIIFDMPPVSPTSVTLRLAGFMDKVLLVIESEKTDRNVVQQATTLLAQSKAAVGAVLNKTRKYIPSRLQQDLNSEL